MGTLFFIALGLIIIFVAFTLYVQRIKKGQNHIHAHAPNFYERAGEPEFFEP